MQVSIYTKTHDTKVKDELKEKARSKKNGVRRWVSRGNEEED